MNSINNKTEEILKWRQNHIMMNDNHGENTPFFLSHQQPQQQEETPLYIPGIQISSTTANSISSPMNNNEIIKTPSKFYITLAKESPNYYDAHDSDTTDTYDSYHDRSTDVCVDILETTESSSSESEQSTEKSTTSVEDLVEYEVASASASEILYSDDSSSGTDGDLITTEIVESKFVSSDKGKRHDYEFGPSDFADTEKSDNSDNSDNCIDSELSPADYWKCVKCKNHQNNPMFRYCEKCYQIRKTHFPPRPKQKKKRKDRNRKTIDRSRLDFSSSPTSSSENELTPAGNKSSKKIYNQQITPCSPDATTSANDIGKNQLNLTISNILTFHKLNGGNSRLNGNNIKTKISKPNNNNILYKKRKLNYTNSNISQLNSVAGTSSSDDDNEDGFSNDWHCSLENSSNLGKNLTSPNKNFNNHKSQIFDTSKSANIIINNFSFNNNRKRKASVVSDGDDLDLKICSQPKLKYVNTINNNKSDINLNLINSETDLVINKNIGNTDDLYGKDSGISSAPSTQDYNDSMTELFQNNSTNESDKNMIKDDGNESSDTVCDELNEKDIVEIEKDVKLSQELNETTHQTNNITKFINNNHKINNENNITNDSLDRHLSEFSPITTNKTNHYSLVPRSISANSIDPFKTNLRTIDSPQSPTNAFSLKNNSTTTNFDDKLSSLLNPLDHQIDSSHGLCIICLTEPKNGAFVHSRFVHLSCCYKCAVKIWNKNKKCPICNCAVKNVMKLFVH